MDDDLTNIDPDLIPVLWAWIRPRDPVGAARYCNVTRLWVPDDDVKLGTSFDIQSFLLDKAVGGCDQDNGVAAQEDCGAPEEAAVAVEESALPGELVLLGHGPAQNPLVTLPPTSGRIFQSLI